MSAFRRNASSWAPGRPEGRPLQLSMILNSMILNSMILNSMIANSMIANSMVGDALQGVPELRRPIFRQVRRRRSLEPPPRRSKNMMLQQPGAGAHAIAQQRREHQPAEIVAHGRRLRS